MRQFAGGTETVAVVLAILGEESCALVPAVRNVGTEQDQGATTLTISTRTSTYACGVITQSAYTHFSGSFNSVIVYIFSRNSGVKCRNMKIRVFMV